jgi:hypothetical protein
MTGKSRRKRNRKKKRAQLSVPKEPNSERPIPKKEPKNEKKPTVTGRVFGLIVAVVGLLSAYFYFRPSVEIEVPSSNSADAQNLFYRPFVIKNNSPWASVYDVNAMCTTELILRGTRAAPEMEANNARADYIPPIKELGAGERSSVPCLSSAGSKDPLLTADVILSLDYTRPWFFYGHTATQQGYKAVIGGDGRGYWTPFVQRK